MKTTAYVWRVTRQWHAPRDSRGSSTYEWVWLLFLTFGTLHWQKEGLTTTVRPFTAMVSETVDGPAAFCVPVTSTQHWTIFLGTIRGAGEIVTIFKAATATQLCVRARSRPLISHRVGLCYWGVISASAAESSHSDQPLLPCFLFSFFVVGGLGWLAPYNGANNSRAAFSAVNRSVIGEKQSTVCLRATVFCFVFFPPPVFQSQEIPKWKISHWELKQLRIGF